VADKELRSLCAQAYFTCDVDTQISNVGEAENSCTSPEILFQTPEILLEEKFVSF